MYLINRHRLKEGGIAMRTIGKVFEKPKKERKPVKTETEKQEQEKQEQEKQEQEKQEQEKKEKG